MADVQTGEHNLITSKWGPLPVWAWSLIGLGLAWLYAKYRSGQQAAAAQAQQQATGSGTDAESQDVAPQFIIENNMPAEAGAPSQPSAPVTAPTPPSTPTPPGKTPNPPTTGKPKPPPTKKPPTPKAPLQYKVKHGDTLSSIAARYHTTWQKLWAYNTTPGNRPASTIATLKKRGPNLLYSNETILIPQ